MAGMKIFRLLQTFYETLGLYSPQSNQFYSSKLRVFNFSTITVLDIASMLGFLLFQAKTVQDYGACFYGLVSMTTCLLDFVVTVRKIPQILKLIESFEVFMEKRSFHSHSVGMNNKLVQKIEWISEMIHFIFIKVSFLAILISPLLVTLVNFFILNMGEESFRFDGSLWFPFDANKPIGFFMAILFQCVATYAVFCCFIPIVCLYIGSCLSIVTFLKEITTDISHLKKRKISNLKEEKLIERFFNFMRFHADVEELTAEFIDIFEFIVFVTFSWGLGTVASSLIVFQSTMSSPNPVELFLPLCLIIWSITVVFFNCEIGQDVSNQFNRLSDEIYKFDWYLLPHKLQRMLIVIIINAQEPVFIRGFGNVVCSRDSFKQTIHTGFSYFMMLHQMDE